MRFLISMVLAIGLLTMLGCSKPEVSSDLAVTRIIVLKEQRRMYLMHGDTVLKRYDVDLGFQPDGHKEAEGDGRTPEGRYTINRRNPDSLFHLSLGISYPNTADRAYAKSIGQEPGGDIFIHGARRPFDKRGADWTAGCISVSNHDIERIYSMVPLGTIIDILP